MMKYYREYYWKKGKPHGRVEVDPNVSPFSYKIVPDPYHRRFSIEKYAFGNFSGVVYDSFLLDFRHIHSPDHAAWQKIRLEEKCDSSKYLLINQDDRAVLIESYSFENNLCRSCSIQSVHGLPIATNKMYYQALGDSFNGMVLFDNEKQPVLAKQYRIECITGDFSDVIREERDMSSIPDFLIINKQTK